MKTQLFVSLYFLKSLSLIAIGYLPPAGGEAIGMGNIGLLGQNTFSPANHQALMPWQKKAGIGFSFTNRFAVADINQVYMTVVIPYKLFGYGLKFYEFGNSTFRENSIGLSVAHAFNEKFSIGFGANYQSVSITRYGYNYAITAEASLVAKVNEQLSFAFRVYNPARAKFSEYRDERLSTTYQFGLGYKVSKQVKTLIEIEKSNAFKPNVKAGVDYSVKEHFHIRLGFSSLQPQFTFGMGFRYKKCVIELASMVHQYMGVSSNLSLSFAIGK